MRNFLDIFKTRERSFISVISTFSIFVTVPLSILQHRCSDKNVKKSEKGTLLRNFRNFGE